MMAPPAQKGALRGALAGPGWRRRADFAALSAWLVACFYLAYLSFRAEGHDFRGYYAAARVLWAGGNPFDYREVASVLLSVTGHMGNNPYYYPPWFAWCFTPLCWLPFPVARGVWLFFNAALWVASLQVLGRLMDWPEPGWRRSLAFLLATFVFAGVTLRYEQLGIVLFALFVALVAALRRGELGLAGVWLALLLVKPNVTLVPVLAVCAWYARRGLFRPAAVMAALTAALFGAATAATPTWYAPVFRDRFAIGLVESLDGPGRTTAVRINTTLIDWLRGFQVRPEVGDGLFLAALAVGVAGCCYTVWKGHSLLFVLSSSLLIGFAVTPYALQYDYPPLAIAWYAAAVASVRSGRATRVLALVSAFIAAVLVWERPISDGYWIVIALCILMAWSRGSFEAGAASLTVPASCRS